MKHVLVYVARPLRNMCCMIQAAMLWMIFGNSALGQETSLGPGTERRVARISGVLLYVLAAYILVSYTVSFFSTRLQPEPTELGVVLLIAAAIILPLLGRAKKKVPAETGSRALRADAAQSNICAYISWVALAGLLVNLFFHLPWADSVAGLLLLPIVLKEASQVSNGEVCEC